MGFFDRFKKKKHQEEELNEQEAVLDENSGETSTESGGTEIGASGYTEAEAPVQPDGGVPAAEEPEQSGNYAAFEAPEAEAEEPLTQPEKIPEPEEPEEIPQAMEAPAPEEETEPEEVPQEEVPEPDFTEESEEAPKKQGFFEKLRNGLKKTKDGFMSKLELLMNSFTKIDEDFFDELEETLILSEARRWLDLYFAGREPGFLPPLHPAGSTFQQAVWVLLLQIPYGQTVTYGELARQLAEKQGRPRMSAQAVGGAGSHNAISIIIPCHRVVGAAGSLTAYAGGIEKKIWLLTHEGVDMKRFFVPKGKADI